MCSVIGLGFVGSALVESFQLKSVSPLYGYDKYKDGGIGSLDDCLKSPIIFICLPTPYDDVLNRYDKTSIHDTLKSLEANDYLGCVVIKSTVEPGTTEEYAKEFPSLSLSHNPEFLSAATAFRDFHNQKHIVLGRASSCGHTQFENLRKFYAHNYPEADISKCSSTESESMKCYVNTFYAVKIQFFNELYLLCQSNNVNYDNVKDLMLKNGWINPMHTTVPGRDGKLSYGGGCFPKDTNALLQHMITQGTPHAVLESCITERNAMRSEGHIMNGNVKTNGKIPVNSKSVHGSFNGHFENGHVENGHFENGHVENGHFENGHVENGHLENGHVENGHFENGYVENVHFENGHIKIGHLENGHLENGHVRNGSDALR